MDSPAVEVGPLAAERVELADVVEDPEVAQRFDLARGAGVTDGLAVAEGPGIEVDFDEEDWLAAEVDGPEVAQRFDVAGGAGVEEGLDVAELLGGPEVEEGLDVAEFLGVTGDLDDVDCLKEAERPEVAQRFNVAGGSGVTEGLDVADECLIST